MQVTTLSKELAVKTLQLEMEYIFGALEDEALDVAQDTENAGFLLSRSFSSHGIVASHQPAVCRVSFGLDGNIKCFLRPIIASFEIK